MICTIYYGDDKNKYHLIRDDIIGIYESNKLAVKMNEIMRNLFGHEFHHKHHIYTGIDCSENGIVKFTVKRSCEERMSQLLCKWIKEGIIDDLVIDSEDYD